MTKMTKQEALKKAEEAREVWLKTGTDESARAWEEAERNVLAVVLENLEEVLKRFAPRRVKP